MLYIVLIMSTLIMDDGFILGIFIILMDDLISMTISVLLELEHAAILIV